MTSRVVHHDALFEILVQRTGLFEEGATFLLPSEKLKYAVTVEFTLFQEEGREPALPKHPFKERRHLVAKDLPSTSAARSLIKAINSGWSLEKLSQVCRKASKPALKEFW